MAEDITGRLNACYERLKALDEQRARLQGEQQALLRRLQEDFGVSSLEEAATLREQLAQAIAEDETKVVDLSGKLGCLMTEIEQVTQTG